MATAVLQKSYIQSSVLGWSPRSDFKDKSGQTYDNFGFSSHAFWKIFVSFFFFLIRNICHLPHPLFPLDPSSCFLTNLLVNLRAFPPFSQKWGLDGDAHSYRHNRMWNSSEQIPWASEAPHFRSPFQAIMFTSKSISCHRMVLRANKSQSFQTRSHLYLKCSLPLCQNTEGSFYKGFFWSRSMKRREGVGHNSS